MVDTFLEGYNCCVLAYGQVQCGCTETCPSLHTMCLFADSIRGIIARVSFVEIYNEVVYDLLAVQWLSLQLLVKKLTNRLLLHTTRSEVVARDDTRGALVLGGLTELAVPTAAAVLNAI